MLHQLTLMRTKDKLRTTLVFGCNVSGIGRLRDGHAPFHKTFQCVWGTMAFCDFLEKHACGICIVKSACAFSRGTPKSAATTSSRRDRRCLTLCGQREGVDFSVGGGPASSHNGGTLSAVNPRSKAKYYGQPRSIFQQACILAATPPKVGAFLTSSSLIPLTEDASWGIGIPGLIMY